MNDADRFRAAAETLRRNRERITRTRCAHATWKDQMETRMATALGVPTDTPEVLREIERAGQRVVG